MDLFLILQQVAQAANSSEIQAILGEAGTVIEPTEEATEGGGRRTRTGLRGEQDLTIPLGEWELRLVPTRATDGSDWELVVEIEEGPEDGGSRPFERLRLHLGRFELLADPDALIPADLLTEPHTHLKARSSGRVKLLGPGFVLNLGGANLSDVGFDFTGATGGSDDEFPSARFEPPHFIVGGTGDELGVACDEVLLDLDRDANPSIVDERLPGVDPAWRGIHLKELGVFIGDGTEVGTWSGMASMRDFFIGLDETDLTGTFAAELVHYALPDAPQVQVAIYRAADGGGETLVEDEGDASVPAPPEGSEYQRVRLEARPNWDSAGFRVQWTAPEGVLVEEPTHLTQRNLGWVRVPPGAHVFTVEVRDHRVETQTESRTVQVAEPDSPAAGTDGLAVVLEGIPDIPELGPGQRPTNRVHVGLIPGQEVVIRAQVAGGTTTSADVTLSLPSGFSFVDPGSGSSHTQATTRGTDTRVFDRVEWRVRAPGSITDTLHEAFELEVTNGPDTERRRLRVGVEDALPSGSPRFDLWSYSDWRADPGIGLARVLRGGGLNFDAITWTLESAPATPTLFEEAVADGLFDGSASTWVDEGPQSLADSAGTVRPFLHETGRVWRLTGSVGAGTPPGPEPLRVLGARPGSAVVSRQSADMAPTAEPPVSGGEATLPFGYDSDEVLPSSVQDGREASPLTVGEVRDHQARAFAALFRSARDLDASLQRVRLVGMASLEGTVDYNQDLGRRRADAVRAELTAPSAGLISAIEALPSDARLTAAEVGAASAVLAGVTIETVSVGERHGSGRLVPDADPDTDPSFDIDPMDRRVFALLEVLSPAAPGEIVRREYFVTLPGAPPPSETPPVPQRQLQEHPFQHSWFRSVHVEVELLRNQLIRLQLKLKVDLEAFNENDTVPASEMTSRDLNRYDGETTFFLEMKKDPDPDPGEPEYRWELVALADPQDIDGFATLNDTEHGDVLQVLGGPAITVPAYTALSGGEVGLAGFGVAAMLGVVLSGTGAIDVKILVWRGIRLELEHGNVDAATVRLAVDYTVKYNIDLDLEESLGIPLVMQTQEPIEIGFRNVGIEIEDLDTVKFFYDPKDGFHLEIDDPGVFQLGEGLGRLLSVNSLRSGAGSPFFLEVEFGLQIETGIFELDTFGIRASLDADKLLPAPGEAPRSIGDFDITDFDFQLTKIGVSVSVPGVLSGSGMVGIREDEGSTTIEGAVDVKLEPIDLTIEAAGKVVQFPEFTAVFGAVGVQFAPGIPLGTTGVAISGFSGLVGAHMKADHGGEPLPWWKGNPPAVPVGAIHPSKWEPEYGNWAFGVGAVLGTVYDTGFTFHMQGMLIVEVPGPRILLGTTGRFLQVQPDLETAMEGGIICVVMLDFENEIFLIGLEFELSIPDLLKLRVPVEIFFNLARARDWHIYFGQWTPKEKRIEIDVLGIFKAWGYVQIEGDQLDNGVLTLAGPAFAMGARIEIFWGSRSAGVYLEAYLEYHAGIQFRPAQVQGLLRVGGELHLGPICLGASGELEIMAPEPLVVRGKICGKLKLFFFTIKGCADFTIGDGDAALPPPADPWTGVSFIDRMTSLAIGPWDPAEDEPEVHRERMPLDAVLHLTFDQDMWDDRMDPALDIVADPQRTQVSDDLFYEFRVDGVRLMPEGSATPFPIERSAWAPYTLRGHHGDGGSMEEDAAAAASARTLRLLSWEPSAHTRAVDFTRGYQDTLRALFHRLCDPTPRPERKCTDFDEEALGPGSYWTLEDEPLAPVRVISLLGQALGTDFLADVAHLSPARIVPLPPLTWPDRHAESRALRLSAHPRAQRRLSLTALFPEAEVHEPGDDDGGGIVRPVPVPVLDAEALARVRVRTRPELDLRGADIRLDEGFVHAARENLEALARTVSTPAAESFDRDRVDGLDVRLTRNPFLTREATIAIGGRNRPDFAGLAPASVLRRADLTRLAPRLTALDVDRVSARSILGARMEAIAETAHRTLGAGAEASSTAYAANPVMALWQSGALLIRLPDAVEVDLTFLLPTSARAGEALFLGRDFKPVSPIFRLRDAPAVPGTTGATGRWIHHRTGRVRFENPPAVETPAVAAWVAVLPPGPVQTKREDPSTYLVDICAVSLGDWQRWRDRERSRHEAIVELEQLTGEVGGEPAVSSQELLEPGRTYHVELDRSWMRYRRRDATDHDGEGTFGDPPEGVGATFTTSSDHPRDIRRYVAAHAPPAPDQPHYFEDPVEIVFGSDVIDELFARFGKQLVVRAKADIGRHVLNEPLSTTTTREFFPLGSFETELLRFLREDDDLCMSADWTRLFPKTVARLSEPLGPNRGYTVTLIPRDLGDPGGMSAEEWNDALQADFEKGRDVFRFDLKTSRWGTFASHVAAYRSGRAGDLIGGDESDLDAALGGSSAERSDEVVETLLGALFGGPVKIPAAPTVSRVWVMTGDPAGPFDPPPLRCRGLLLDGPEPLLRRRTDGTDRTRVRVRAIPTVGAPTAGTPIADLRVVAGARGARVLLLFSESPPPSALRIIVEDVPLEGGPTTTETFDLAVGSVPASFQEDA